MESENYSKVVNIAKKKKKSRVTNIENKSFLTSGECDRDNIRVREYRVQTIGYKIGLRIYYTM